MDKILVGFWDYFIPPEIKKIEAIEEPEVTLPPRHHSLANIVLDEDDDKNYDAPITPESQRVYNFLSSDSEDIFESEMILLKSVGELIKDVSYNSETIINAELNELFSIKNYTYDIKDLWVKELIPVLVKSDIKYLNLFESCIYREKNISIRFPNNVRIKLTNYYGIVDIKVKNAILIAIILGINLNLYCRDIKVEISVKDSNTTLNYLYYNGFFYSLIKIDDFSKSQDYVKVDAGIF